MLGRLKASPTVEKDSNRYCLKWMCHKTVTLFKDLKMMARKI